MDSLDVEVKTSVAKNIEQAVAETSQGEEEQVSKPARINANATSHYITVINHNKGLLCEGHARTYTQLSVNLNEYLKDPETLDVSNLDEDSAELGHYRKLTSQVINRDPALQEKVAQDLSTGHQLVRSKDASAELEKNLKKLPEALSEGTPAGKNLSKFICQSVVNLTDYENMGAGLQRDLSIRQVYPPTQELSLRQKTATADALTASIAYVKSNQPEVLATIKEELKVETTKPGTTTPQIMTQYLRQALEEFPEDSTYLDIFKQNRNRQSGPVDGLPDEDKISQETSKRIHDVIMKAAISARKGNLITETDQNTKTAQASSNSTVKVTPELSKAEDISVDAAKLSLSELSARAAKLQQQFREDRMRLVQEGKLPDPASLPKTENVSSQTAEDPKLRNAQDEELSRIREQIVKAREQYETSSLSENKAQNIETVNSQAANKEPVKADVSPKDLETVQKTPAQPLFSKEELKEVFKDEIRQAVKEALLKEKEALSKLNEESTNQKSSTEKTVAENLQRTYEPKGYGSVKGSFSVSYQSNYSLNTKGADNFNLLNSADTEQVKDLSEKSTQDRIAKQLNEFENAKTQTQTNETPLPQEQESEVQLSSAQKKYAEYSEAESDKAKNVSENELKLASDDEDTLEIQKNEINRVNTKSADTADEHNIVNVNSDPQAENEESKDTQIKVKTAADTVSVQSPVMEDTSSEAEQPKPSYLGQKLSAAQKQILQSETADVSQKDNSALEQENVKSASVNSEGLNDDEENAELKTQTEVSQNAKPELESEPDFEEKSVDTEALVKEQTVSSQTSTESLVNAQNTASLNNTVNNVEPEIKPANTDNGLTSSQKQLLQSETAVVSEEEISEQDPEEMPLSLSEDDFEEDDASQLKKFQSKDASIQRADINASENTITDEADEIVADKEKVTADKIKIAEDEEDSESLSVTENAQEVESAQQKNVSSDVAKFSTAPDVNASSQQSGEEISLNTRDSAASEKTSSDPHSELDAAKRQLLESETALSMNPDVSDTEDVSADTEVKAQSEEAEETSEKSEPQVSEELSEEDKEAELERLVEQELEDKVVESIVGAQIPGQPQVNANTPESVQNSASTNTQNSLSNAQKALLESETTYANTGDDLDSLTLVPDDEPEYELQTPAVKTVATETKPVEGTLEPLKQTAVNTETVSSEETEETETEEPAISEEQAPVSEDDNETVTEESEEHNNELNTQKGNINNAYVPDDEANEATENISSPVQNTATAAVNTEEDTINLQTANTLSLNATATDAKETQPQEVREETAVLNNTVSTTDTAVVDSDSENTLQNISKQPQGVVLEQKAQAFSSEAAALKEEALVEDNKTKAPETKVNETADEDNEAQKEALLKAQIGKPAFLSSSSSDKAVQANSQNVNQSTVANNQAQNAASVRSDSIGEKILGQTIPLSELDDNIVPADVEGESKDLSNITRAHEDENITISRIPDKTPGAAAITQGQSEPIPEQSVVDNSHAVKEKSGLFAKIASIFSKKTQTAEVRTNIEPTMEISNNAPPSTFTPKGSPLDNMLYTLRVQTENAALPQAVRDEAKKFIEALENPIEDLPSVSNWLNFTSGPMSPSSSQALALHQWAFFLLSIRFSQIGKSVDKFLKRNADLMEDRFDKVTDEVAKNIGKEQQKIIPTLIEDTFDQVVRMQNPQKEGLPALFQYIPLPPSYEGGREGNFSARPVVEEDGKKSWHLNFVFDLKNLGPIEIKAVAKLPELKLSVIASTFEGLQQIQKAMPTLKKQLQDLGITTTSSNTRLGKVHIADNKPEAVKSAPKADGSSFSVDIQDCEDGFE